MRLKILGLIVLLAVLYSCKPASGFRFERIAFHSSACFGYCPSYHMEVRSDHSLRLKGDTLFGRRPSNPDATRVGYYKATLNDSLYLKLTQELRTIGLDTLQFNGPDCCDGSTKTLIVYYNGKRKYLRAMFPPDYAHTLIATLSDIYTLTQWKISEERFEIEIDSAAH